MAYNWQMGDAPGTPTPNPAPPPMRRPVGGKKLGKGMMRTADGRVLASRPPGTRLYVPGYMDPQVEFEEMMEHVLDVQQLGLAIPVVPIVGALGKKLLGKGPDKTKWRDRSNRVSALAARANAGDMSAIVELETIGKGWGTAYNPIIKAAHKAASAARSKLASAAPPGTAPAAPATNPVTLVPAIPGVIPAPITYTPPGQPTEMVPPAAPAVAPDQASAGGFDMKSLALPIGIGLGLLFLSGRRRTSR